jgi:tRNA(Ile2) C34 agmatinyltransferase TiaS
MQSMRLTTVRVSADVISGILNGVCPECGGRMGGPGKEFKCQGECQRDWRQVWERVLSAGLDWRSNRAINSGYRLGASERD